MHTLHYWSFDTPRQHSAYASKDYYIPAGYQELPAVFLQPLGSLTHNSPSGYALGGALADRYGAFKIMVAGGLMFSRRS